jgi:hypothetical protein
VSAAVSSVPATVSAATDPIAEEITMYWQSLESQLGYRSSQGAMVDRLNGFTGTRSDAYVPFEHFACWSNAMGKRMARVATALRELPSHQVQLLYRVYGPRDPHTRRSLGEAAALAEYTPTVERHRDRMVEERIQQRLRAMRAAEEQREKSATAIAAAARVRMERARQEIIRLREIRGERGLTEPERAELLQWRGELAAAEARAEEALRARLSDDAFERAAQGMRISTNREITTAEALRDLLDRDPIQAPNEPKKLFVRRLKTTREARSAVAERIADEAADLLSDARAAFCSVRGDHSDAARAPMPTPKKGGDDPSAA